MIARNLIAGTHPKHFYIDNVQIKEVGAASTCKVEYSLEYAADYYPYGKILREFQNGLGAEKYLTTKNERDQETGWDYRLKRYSDADIVRFGQIDSKDNLFPQWSPYSYVLGNPLMNTDENGDCPTCPKTKKLSFYGSIKLTSGEIGIKGKIFGIPFGLSGSPGGSVEQEYSFKFSLLDNGQTEGEFKHIQREVESGSYTFGAGPYGGTDKRVKETTTKYDINEGFSQTKDEKFVEKKDAKIKNVTIKENSLDVGIKASVNLYLLGFGISSGVETSEQSTTKYYNNSPPPIDSSLNGYKQ